MALHVDLELLPDVCPRRIKVGGGARAEVQIAAFAREFLRHREADAARCACHQRGESRQFQVHA